MITGAASRRNGRGLKMGHFDGLRGPLAALKNWRSWKWTLRRALLWRLRIADRGISATVLFQFFKAEGSSIFLYKVAFYLSSRTSSRCFPAERFTNLRFLKTSNSSPYPSSYIKTVTPLAWNIKERASTKVEHSISVVLSYSHISLH